jgi:hypothetical protein
VRNRRHAWTTRRLAIPGRAAAALLLADAGTAGDAQRGG